MGLPAPPAGRALLYSTIFFTNFLSLACQVLWLRQLTYLFGSTAAVFSTVLSVFLLGLALGARWAGRRADRDADPRRSLGKILLGLGAYCLFSIPLFEIGWKGVAALLPGDLAPLPSGLAKLIATAVLLIAPTAAIGAVFPLSVRAAGRSLETLGRDLALLYGLDTLGAATGALVSGFLLVPLLGLTLSTRLLGAGALALGALLLATRTASRERARSNDGEPGPKPAPKRRRAERTMADSLPARLTGVQALSPSAERSRGKGPLLAAFFATGAGALLLETGWNRFFSLLNGTHVYSTSSVLTGFLLGIGLGSLLMARQIERLRNPHGFAAALFALVPLGGLAVFHSEKLFTRFYFGLFHATSSYIPFQLLVCAGIGVLVFLATLPMGANFPLVARLVTPVLDARGAGAGQAFFVNTLGAVAGAFAAEFLVLPAWGFSGLALVVLLTYGGAAGVFLAAAPRERRGAAIATTGCALLAAALWSPLLTPFKPPLHGLYYHGLRLGSLSAFDREAARMKVVEQRQGFYGQVAVVDYDRYLLLKHNGKTDSSSAPVDNKTQVLLGHLPLLFSPKPERVLVIGLGGGFTLQAVVQHPEPREITVVEIDPLVVDLARRHFAKANGRALDDRRVRVVTNDGRNFLASSRRKYDVISSEPPNIWVAGVSGLFTQEFYRAASDRLATRGILCQWIPLYEMKKEDFRVMLHTLTSIFPYVTFWQIGTDVVFIASNDPLGADPEDVANRLRRPAVRANLAAIELTPEDLFVLLNDPVVLPDQVPAFLGQIETLNTDDKPVLEFSTARNLYGLAKDPLRATRPGPAQ
jgi:spermidine synthase